jgi:hypothetical protein
MKFTLFFLLFSFSAQAQDIWGYCTRAGEALYSFGYSTAKILYDNTQIILSGEENLKAEAKKDHLEHCIHKDKYGCLYKRKYLYNYFSDTLIIYLRGHLPPYGGNVPDTYRDQSLREVIATYELHKTYDQLQDPMLISPSSDVGYTIDEINSAIKAASLPADANIILAAHSGGNVGLIKTLKYLGQKPYKFKVKKIIMLDNFYFSAEETPTIKKFISGGAECNGFLTVHNSARYNNRFQNQISSSDCTVDVKGDHYNTVNKCLVQYIKQDTCDVKI